MNLVSELSKYPLVSIDVETTGVHWYRDTMFGVAVAAADGPNIISEYYDIREQPWIVDILRQEIPRCRRIVNHSIKFDAHFLLNRDIDVPLVRLECTSVRAALINEHEHSFSLDSLSKKYLGRRKVDIYSELAALFGGQPTRDAQITNLHRAPVALVRKYATPDPELALLLWMWQEDEISKQNLGKVWDLERRLLPVLIHMERHGVAVDLERTHSSKKKIADMVGGAQHELEKLAGKKVNANSPPQIKALLKPEKREDDRWRVGNVLLKSTSTGGPSIDADALRQLTDAGHPMAAKVLQVRKLDKARQFLDGHILGHQLDGRVYPNYNQTRGDNELGTGTGRFSVNDPALQQIPGRDVEVASIVRACFIPDEPSHEWCTSDWNQFEFRWFAHYAKNPVILKKYQDDPDTDYHRAVADETGLPRSPRFAGDPNAKQINLGLVFGMGEGKMAAEMGLDYEVSCDSRGREWLVAGPKAKEIFQKYHEAIPGVKSLLERASSIAKSRGHVQTVMGRHIRFPGGQFTHKAAGLVFQGTSADCMKVKMIELHQVCESLGVSMLLSVHDELGFSVPTSQKEIAKEVIKARLESFGPNDEIQCRVPVRASVGFGPDWWKASKGG